MSDVIATQTSKTSYVQFVFTKTTLRILEGALSVLS